MHVTWYSSRRYLCIQLEDLGNCEDAMEYIKHLPFRAVSFTSFQSCRSQSCEFQSCEFQSCESHFLSEL